MSTETDAWLATMRSAWKAGVDRDERQNSATSARRLARIVAPDAERPRRHTAGELLVLAACLVACALLGMRLHYTMTGPRSGAVHEILADRPQQTAPAENAPAEPAPAVAPAVSSASSAASTRPAPAPSAKVKSETEALPPLPRPPPSNERAPDDRTKKKMKRFELRFERRWRTPPPPPPPVAHPPRLPQGLVRDL